MDISGLSSTLPLITFVAAGQVQSPQFLTFKKHRTLQTPIVITRLKLLMQKAVIYIDQFSTELHSTTIKEVFFKT
jgi:energy-converting hydrogenase Eha subunit E